MKKLLVLIPFILAMCFMFAQVAEYSFVQSNETYTEITGGTVVATGIVDDVQYAVAPPFGFNFNFVPVTAMAMSTNGYLSFNAGTTTFSYAAISSAAVGTGVVAPLSRDLRGGTTGEMRWEVFGTAPERYAVYQWKNWRDYSGSADDSWNFQVILYETSNNIAIRYGTFTWAGTYTNSYQVGLRGATNADFKNRTTTADWNATVPGTLNNATCLVSTTVYPASGLQFAFNYPMATGVPNPAMLVAPANGGWAFTGQTLNWNSGGGMADSYDVYYGTTNPPAFIQNQTANSYVPTLVAGTTYYWQIVPRNSFGPAEGCPVWSFMTPAATQLAESFEATSFPPAGWANGTTGNWTRSTSVAYAKHGVASAYKYGSTSIQYVLSSPRLTITESSTLDFWSGVSTATGQLQVVYSPDRVTWTQIGANITHAVAATMYRSVIDLSPLAGNNYYIGFRNDLQAVSFYVDAVVGPEITPEAPGAPVLSAPADLAINVSEYTSFSWTAPIIGGVPTGYRVYCDTNNPPTTMVADVATLNTTLTAPLAYGTMHYWTVEAYNGAGTGAQATVRSFTTRENPIISTFPWQVDFGTLTSQWPVLNWTQLSGIYPAAPIVGTFWYQDDWLNVTTPANKAAKINIYGNRGGWLVTPPIDIPADGYELKFDAALMTWNSVSTPVTPGNQPDDRFIVFMADNPMMNNPTILREWNNTGSPFVFDNISPNGINVSLVLTGITGIKYFAFYGETTVSNGDNDLMIDNVIVRETPAVPILSVNPMDWDFGIMPVGGTATKQFALSNIGSGSLTISSISISGDYYSLTSNPAPVDIAIGETQFFTVQYAPTAQGTHTGNVEITDNLGRTVTNIPLSGSAALVVYMQNGSTTVQMGESWNFYDTGGPANTYQNSENFTYTFNAPAGYLVTSTFSVFSLESGFDNLYVYDGQDITAPLLGQFSGTTIPGPFQASPATGSLTFRFTSDTSVTYDGWEAIIGLMEAPAGPPEAVTLNSPANGATGLPIAGFNLSWTPAVTGGVPSYYAVFMATDEAEIYGQEYWETTNTQFNPVTEGAFVFANDTRYYWTVQAINNDGDAIVEPPYWFEIESPVTAIDTFPWIETFEGGVFPPANWSTADLDAQGTVWEASITYNHTDAGTTSAKHGYSVVPATGQDGWMITPPVAVPTGLNMVLSFWNYNVWPTYMVYNGVKVNTTNDPADPNWVELWSADVAAAAWSQAVVNISAYGGQTVYFAFNYQGYDGDDWYVDDVSIFELLVDESAPTITHLPVLNTPLDDVNYLVYADIVDDPTWNNPIDQAQLWYTTDDANYTMVPMIADTRMGYYAYIPAQPLGTTIGYYMEASDSENNWANSPNFSFTVADPTWIWYDQGGTTYLGFTPGTSNITTFGPTVLFENPFFGTGIPMQLNATDGSSYYGNTANLHVYSYDGVTMTDLITPLPVVFGAQTYEVFDLTAYNILINTEYFLVAYEDIPATATGNYILWDDTYNYGTSYCRILSDVHTNALYTLSRSGSWAIGANVQSGPAGMDAPVVTIAMGTGGPELSWSAVDGAMSYNVYGSADPYAVAPWTMLGNTAATSWTYTGTDMLNFFQVKADTNAPTRAAVNGLKKSFDRSNVRSADAQNAPKNRFGLRGIRN